LKIENVMQRRCHKTYLSSEKLMRRKEICSDLQKGFWKYWSFWAKL
jgi:hypothetical protein